KGVASYANGDVYEGSFVAGKRQGAGVMRYASGRVTEGEWRDDQLKEDANAPAAAAEGSALPAEPEVPGGSAELPAGGAGAAPAGEADEAQSAPPAEETPAEDTAEDLPAEG